MLAHSVLCFGVWGTQIRGHPGEATGEEEASSHVGAPELDEVLKESHV